METTRHFTATAYIVHDGATALHRHERLGIHVPPGGHIDRDELPHEAALREVREETGLEPTLIDDTNPIDAPAGETLPEPRHMMLYDVNVFQDERVGHQHVDHVYFAAVDRRTIDPAAGESPASRWEWYTPDALRERQLAADTVEIALEAISVVDDAIDW
ncbi:MAG: NUDIX domain-containing protein [Halobacteriota archaeon]